MTGIRIVTMGLTFLLMAGAVRAQGWLILKPSSAPKAYAIAAEEFQKFYKGVTGQELSIVTEPDEDSHLVVIGSDSVNRFCRTAVENKIIPRLNAGADTDAYCLRSAEKKGRKFLFLAGGNGRGTLYAVYDFFERRAGCRYFWDGDIVPKRPGIEMDGLDVTETPRFAYRGLRYFAHRSLDRFQAEHWGAEQWNHEIEWILKKRLNLFMLRIGMDDVYQKAFPDIVPYPPDDGALPEAIARSYNDRTSAWPLEYRGELRKHVLQYARDRGLIHPEDTGTMTHWYSRTPHAFLEEIKPEFTPQMTRGYSEKTGLVWDIRDDQNLDNYWKLTQAHIDHYGSPQMFHTIGLAERNVFTNRADNLEMKLYAYRRIISKLREHYPVAPLQIASWDLYHPGWRKPEIQRLLDMLDPENTLIFDYTSDLPHLHDQVPDFRDWGVVGKFPWVFGIFHAYEWQSDLRGNYANIRERMPIAAADPMCKGFVYWPENSHSDSLMLEFFTKNAWNPDTLTPEELLPEFCRDRYQGAAESMRAAWLAALPLIKAHTRMPFEPRRFAAQVRTGVSLQKVKARRSQCKKLAPLIKGVPALCRQVADLPFGKGDAFVDRDAIDLARTIAGRVYSYALARYIVTQDEWRQGRSAAAEVKAAGEQCTAILTALRDILALHDDYSMNSSMAKLKAIHPVNPCVEQTLKGNAENGYCRSYIYELFNDYYLPQLAVYTDWVDGWVASNNKGVFMKPAKPLSTRKSVDTFYAKPLVEMAPPKVKHADAEYCAVMTRLATICSWPALKE